MGKFSFFSQNQQIRSAGKLLDLSAPVVMGILNLSGNSFFADSSVSSTKALLELAEKHAMAGAGILDLGAVSSRPGAGEVGEEDEWRLLYPALLALRHEFPEHWISIDTWRSGIVRRAAIEGCDLVNDISAGLRDPSLLEAVAAAHLPYILMHMRGTPQTMSGQNSYNDLLSELLFFFQERIQVAGAAGIFDIIIDPGFGFSKVREQNFKLLQQLHGLQVLGYPILAGISRKSMIAHLLETDAQGALNGTTAAHILCLQQGARILRVHDVKEAVQAIKVFEALESA